MTNDTPNIGLRRHLMSLARNVDVDQVSDLVVCWIEACRNGRGAMAQRFKNQLGDLGVNIRLDPPRRRPEEAAR